MEDYVDFDQPFLDSMLKVEVTEEDREFDIPKIDDGPLDNSRTLPPIPTFDLQSETYRYQDSCRRVLVKAVSKPASVSKIYPQILQLGSQMPDVNVSSTLKSNMDSNLQARKLTVTSGVTPKISSCELTTSLRQIVNQVIQKSDFNSKETLQKHFQQKLFKPEFTSKVFTKKDEHGDTLVPSNEEMEYYNTCFKDVSNVQYCRLHCTICEKHLGCGADVEKRLVVHKILKILICKSCSEFYGDGNFPCDKGDNSEIYCSWCGQGGALVCCSFCPRVFCKKCVKRNYGVAFVQSIQRASDWACFCCALKPLWPHRAICRALIEYLTKKKTDPNETEMDTTFCCPGLYGRQNEKLGESSLVMKNFDRTSLNKALVLPGSELNLLNKIPLSVKVSSRQKQLFLKKNALGKCENKESDKRPVSAVRILQENRTVDKVSIPLSVNAQNFSGDSVQKSSLPRSNSQFPILHCEPVLSQPGSKLVIPAQRSTHLKSQPVKVSLVKQTPNLDTSKFPTIKIPSVVHGSLLRIAMPDNRVQFVKLVAEGSPSEKSNDFPMSEFKCPSFVEENLQQSLTWAKTLFDTLSCIKEKVNTTTLTMEENAFISAVNNLHALYEESSNHLQEIDKNLLNNFKMWKDSATSDPDVIELSDDETDATQGKKPLKSNVLLQNNDNCSVKDSNGAQTRKSDKSKAKGVKTPNGCPLESTNVGDVEMADNDKCPPPKRHKSFRESETERCNETPKRTLRRTK